MAKKTSPIEAYSGKDATFLRNFFLSVINDEMLAKTATGMKVRVEAAKNLARLQHLLQVDKKVERISPQEKKKTEELTPTEIARVDSILNES